MRKNCTSRGWFSPLKIMAILTLGAASNVLIAWWLEAAPRNPLLLYPDSWREYFNHNSSPTNWDIWAESFPLHDAQFSAIPLDGEHAENGVGLLVQWGQSRVGRSLANAQAINNNEELSLDAHTGVIIGITNERIAGHLPSLPPAQQSESAPSWITTDDAITEILPSFAALPEFMDGAFATPRAHETTVGWPARSLAMLQYFDALGNPQQQFMLQLPNSIVDAMDSGVVLPLRPLPLGFTINTLFYAGIVFGTWEGLGFARRSRRRRKGLCTKCAHSLEGLPENAPCPECGTEPRANHPTKTSPASGSASKA